MKPLTRPTQCKTRSSRINYLLFFLTDHPIKWRQKMESRDDLVEFYFSLGIPYKQIAFTLSRKHGCLISERSVKRVLRRNGLFRRKGYTNLETVVRFISRELQGSGSCHGYRWMYEKCKLNGLIVRKEHVRAILSALDPVGTEIRRSRRLHRRTYFSKGPNFIWHMDSYDKLRPYGLCINGCIDGFYRKLIWLNVNKTVAYGTSRNSSEKRTLMHWLVKKVSCTGPVHIINALRDFGVF